MIEDAENIGSLRHRLKRIGAWMYKLNSSYNSTTKLHSAAILHVGNSKTS